MLRKVMYVFLIIFFIVASFAAYTFIVSVRAVDQGVVEPVADLVQGLFVPATPVILPDASIILREVNDLAELTTVEEAYQEVITAERNRDVLFGALGESLIFVAYGRVYAGVDLAKMTPADIQVVDPDTVMVHLPDAEIFDRPVLDNELSYVADRDTGLLAGADPELETQVRQEAERVILSAAAEGQIVERANVNAQQIMLEFLQGAGFEEVIFTAETPPTPEPFEQEIPKGYQLVTPTPGG